MDNLAIYEQVRAVPAEAQKPITGGRLNGMTDINPMWRIKKLTEIFGAAGKGWYYTVDRKWTEDGANEEKAAFVDISLYVKAEGEWSAPIPGTGGAMLVVKERAGLRTDDEAFKKALTDAVSVACKALGVGADIYWNKDATKYTNPQGKSSPQGDGEQLSMDELKKSFKSLSEKYMAVSGKASKEVAVILKAEMGKTVKEFTKADVEQSCRLLTKLIQECPQNG